MRGRDREASDARQRRLRILCTGDVHMGRRPKGLPLHLDGSACSTTSAWHDIVRYALEHEVDLVLLTGDLVDRDNRFFEAYGPLEHGLERLAKAGIQTVAVAGNHDYDVLPRLIGRIGPSAFRLLGGQGNWESVNVPSDSPFQIRVVGWSFPKAHVTANPMDDLGLTTFDAEEAGDLMTIGMLHADLDQPQSRYAPVRSSEFVRGSATLWCLGHQHTSRRIQVAPDVTLLYPGTPQPLDPTETDAHGPWWIEVGDEGVTKMEQVPLARLRYERVEVDVTGREEVAEVESDLLGAVKERLEEVSSGAPSLRHLSCRIVLSGRTRLYGVLRSGLGELTRDLELRSDDATAGVESVQVAAEPAYALEELAQSSDAVGLLADLILRLERGEAQSSAAELVTATRQRIERVYQAKPYRPLQRDEKGAPTEDEAAECLLEQAKLLLETLLSQKEEAGYDALVSSF